MRSLVLKRAPGRDGISSEAWRYVKESIQDINLTYKIMNEIMNNKLPNGWMCSVQ